VAAALGVARAQARMDRTCWRTVKVKSGYQLFVKGGGGLCRSRCRVEWRFLADRTLRSPVTFISVQIFSCSNVRAEVLSKTEFNRRTEAAVPCSLCTIQLLTRLRLQRFRSGRGDRDRHDQCVPLSWRTEIERLTFDDARRQASRGARSVAEIGRKNRERSRADTLAN
jgi:hypothetical protein